MMTSLYIAIIFGGQLAVWNDASVCVKKSLLGLSFMGYLETK